MFIVAQFSVRMLKGIGTELPDLSNFNNTNYFSNNVSRFLFMT